MIHRLGHLVEQVTTPPGDDIVPFVALENLGSRTGSLLPDTELPLRAPDPTGMTGFRPGDVLFGKLRPYLAKSWRADRRGCCSTELIVMRPRPSVDGRWLAYLAQSDLLVEWAVATSEGVKMPRTSWEKIRLLQVDAPTKAEQHAIADYLNAETARLDDLVEMRRTQLVAYRDRLASEVERRVLGYLGTSGRVSQPSPFFESRPSDWRETTLRHLDVEVQTGPFGSQLHAEEYVEGGTPIINPMHLVDGAIVPSNDMTVADDKKLDLSRHTLDVGDIVVARRGELGRVAVVDQASAGYLCGTGCLRLRPRRSLVRSGYLSMLLSSAPLRGYFDTASVGSTMDNLSAETLLAAPVLVPPPERQADIEVAVRVARGHADGVIELMSRQIELLLERRHVLITKALTGQLDTPGVAA